jgi:hypothetical protein
LFQNQLKITSNSVQKGNKSNECKTYPTKRQVFSPSIVVHAVFYVNATYSINPTQYKHLKNSNKHEIALENL